MAETTQLARGEIAQLLHDTLCQTLGGAGLLVHVLASRCQAGRAVELPEIEELAEILARALDETRAVLQELQSAPAGLDGGGVERADARA